MTGRGTIKVLITRRPLTKTKALTMIASRTTKKRPIRLEIWITTRGFIET
jgi:hypothetical protein